MSSSPCGTCGVGNISTFPAYPQPLKGFLHGRGVNSRALKALSYMETSATILLVEDHIVTRKFLADNLAADGFALMQAANLEEALQLLEGGYPDLVLLDLTLPDGDGLELLRNVRASDAACSPIDPDLPLLVLTGRTGELDRLRGFRHGCDDYMLNVFAPFARSDRAARLSAGNSLSSEDQSTASCRT